jgi:uncharacterized protein
MRDTLLALDDSLPLTCSRAGTCCFDKAVWINPWEVACLAAARALTPRDFRDQLTVDGGIRLRVDEDDRLRCGQYDPSVGCLAHAGRPLACRLFPLARRREGEDVRYMHRGEAFPCLAGCPEVRDLPSLTVADYLRGQEVGAGEAAQDAYLEVMLELAEAALVLLLEGGLAKPVDDLARWRQLGRMTDDERAGVLPAGWFDALTVPQVEAPLDDPTFFVQQHFALLQGRSEAALAASQTPAALSDHCRVMMASSLHLGRSIGVDPVALAGRWITTAEQHLGPRR